MKKVTIQDIADLITPINEHFNNEFDKMHKNDLAG